MEKLLKAFLYSVILAFLSLFSVSFFWESPFLLAAILAGIGAAFLLLWRNWEDFYLYVIAGIAGAMAEGFAIAFGTWTYALPNLHGVPVWLPFLWGIAALFIKKTALEIHEFVKKHHT